MLAFVYGTLTDPDRVASVVDDWAFEGPATLSGCHRVEGRYPTLAPGGRVDGRLLRTDDAAALDAYEGVDEGLYVRVAVPVALGEGVPVGDGQVAVYVGDPERLDAPATWPGDGPFEARVRRGLADRDAVVRAAER